MYELNYFNDRQDRPLATFSNGRVFYKDTNSQIGSYDSNGNVFRKENGCLIGQVVGDRIYMDRNYQYDIWCEIMSNQSSFKEFAEELKSRPGNCMPYMKMGAARLNGAWIESFDSQGIDYYGDPADVVGSAAAFLIVIEDKLVEDKRSEFYSNSNLQKEYYFRRKILSETGGIGKYIRFFEELYGDYPGTDMN